MKVWRAGAGLAFALGGALVSLVTWVIPLDGVRAWMTSLPIVAHTVAFPHVWVVGGILLVLASALAAVVAEFGGTKRTRAVDGGGQNAKPGRAEVERSRSRRGGFSGSGRRKEKRADLSGTDPGARRLRARLAAFAAFCWAIAGISPLAGLAPLEARAVASGHVTEGWRTLNVLEWNVGSSVESEEIAQLVRERAVDVAVLPEQASGSLDLTGYELFESGSSGSVAPVTVAVRSGLGTYREVALDGAEVTFGGLLLEPAVGEGGVRWLPRILAVHAAPPVFGLTAQWSADQQRIWELAERYAPTQADPRPLLVVGDFNAARWHGAQAKLGSYADVLEWVDPLRRGTWPSSVPGLTSLEGIWRSPIDHILVPVAARDHTAASSGKRDVSNNAPSPGAVRVGHVEVMRRQSSDHMAVYAMLQIRELAR